MFPAGTPVPVKSQVTTVALAFMAAPARMALNKGRM
jgi:hypothetical protein